MFSYRFLEAYKVMVFDEEHLLQKRKEPAATPELLPVPLPVLACFTALNVKQRLSPEHTLL
jgi:hypothetical protein